MYINKVIYPHSLLAKSFFFFFFFEISKKLIGKFLQGDLRKGGRKVGMGLVREMEWKGGRNGWCDRGFMYYFWHYVFGLWYIMY